MKRELQAVLATDILRVFITKRGKSEKALVCTLNDALIPPQHRGRRDKNEGVDTMSIYDMEKECWRPINVDAIIGMERVERVHA